MMHTSNTSSSNNNDNHNNNNNNNNISNNSTSDNSRHRHGPAGHRGLLRARAGPLRRPGAAAPV